MGSIKEEAINSKTVSKVKNISELQVIDVDFLLQYEEATEFPYKFIEVNGVRYRIPKSVLDNLRIMLEDNPQMKKFKVKRTGTTKDDTRYTVIPLM